MARFVLYATQSENALDSFSKKVFKQFLDGFFEKIHEIFRFFEKMISGSVRNLVSGFLVSGFSDQIRNLRDQGFSKH